MILSFGLLLTLLFLIDHFLNTCFISTCNFLQRRPNYGNLINTSPIIPFSYASRDSSSYYPYPINIQAHPQYSYLYNTQYSNLNQDISQNNKDLNKVFDNLILNSTLPKFTDSSNENIVKTV